MMPDSEKKHRKSVAAASVLALLGIAGCSAPPIAVIEGLDDSNGRTAYIRNEVASGNASYKDNVAASGAAASKIAGQGGTALSQVFVTEDIHDASAFVQNGPGSTTYIGANGFAEVTRIADVDKDGTPDDTFLVYTQHNPLGPQRTEYSVSYSGTRAPGAVIEELSARPVEFLATYKGSATVRGSIQDRFVQQTGDVDMTVRFGDARQLVAGTIVNLKNEGETPPFPFDRYYFQGQLLDRTSPDYAINMFGIQTVNSATHTTDGEASGVGSLFGPRAGGTIGVISYSGKIRDEDGGGRANLLTTYTGSTTDTK